MRLAILSDIHGNLTALDAVIGDVDSHAVDRVILGGDLVFAGCRPAEVTDRLRELGWPGVVGNTDEMLWRPEQRQAQLRRAPKLADMLAQMFDELAPATLDLIGPERLDWLRGLPAEQRIDDLLVLHAGPGNLWQAPMADADDEELLAAYGSCDAALVVYGHIHHPFVRSLGTITVANSGSVGAPFDGDPRASYLLVEEGEVRIVRVEYDVEREVALLLDSGYPDASRIAETRRQGRFVAVGGD